MQDLYLATVGKAEYIQQEGYRLVSVQGCKNHRELVADEEMARHFDQHETVTSLESRIAFLWWEDKCHQIVPSCGMGDKITYF